MGAGFAVQLRVKFLLVGLLLLGLGAYAVATSNFAKTYQSTFNVLPSRWAKVVANLQIQTSISGQFSESSGSAVNFYLMSSVQYAAFQTSGRTDALYAIEGQASASIAFTTTAQDTYYMVFAHLASLSGTTETVNFQRTYVNVERFQLFSGAAMITLGALEVAWAVRAKPAVALPPPPG